MFVRFMVATMDILHALIAHEGGTRAFARKLGYGHSYISRVSTRHVTPSFEFLARVRRTYGVILDPADFDTVAGGQSSADAS